MALGEPGPPLGQQLTPTDADPGAAPLRFACTPELNTCERCGKDGFRRYERTRRERVCLDCLQADFIEGRLPSRAPARLLRATKRATSKPPGGTTPTIPTSQGPKDGGGFGRLARRFLVEHRASSGGKAIEDFLAYYSVPPAAQEAARGIATDMLAEMMQGATPS